MAPLSHALVACQCLLSAVAAQNVLPVSVEAKAPQGASAPIDPSFAGFGIEPSNLFSFMGMDKPNELTTNLLDNLVGYTGRPPHFRIGGNTGDTMIYSEDQDAWDWKHNPKPVGQGNFPTDEFIVGPHYFDVANRLPKGTPVTWGLNLAYREEDYVERITAMAQQVLDRCDNLNVVSFEIGNEPDLYGENGFRPGQWDGQTYTKEWLDRAKPVWEQVLKPRNISSDFFEPGCTASTIATNFQIDDLVEFGIDAQAPDSDTGYIASWNQHDYYYYIGVSTYDLTMDHFMQLSTTEDQFKAWVKQTEQAFATPHPYALREMGVVGPIGMEGITNTFGAALWTLNFFFYAATLNISTVQLHMTDNSNASAWQPVKRYNRDPFVRPLYYGYAAFDQVIGPSCNAQVAQVRPDNYPGGYKGYAKVYSVYQGGDFASLVAINAKMANTTEQNKASLSVELSLPSTLAGKTLHLAYLTNDGADATKDTLWNGISFEQSGNGKPTQVHDDDKTVKIGDDGKVTLTVRDSEAVVATLERKVGSGLKADKSACAAVVAQSPGVGPTANPSEGDAEDKDDKDDAAVGLHAPLALVTVTVGVVAGILLL